jgi:hypothetical protein
MFFQHHSQLSAPAGIYAPFLAGFSFVVSSFNLAPSTNFRNKEFLLDRPP